MKLLHVTKLSTLALALTAVGTQALAADATALSLTNATPRAVATQGDKQDLSGGVGVIVAILAAAAVVVGIIIAADNNNSPVSQ